MAYGTFSVAMDRLETARRRYSREVRPITYLPIYLKAVALAVARHPEANAILFRKPFGYRVVQFERVDVSLPITRKIGDRWVTFIGTVRDAPAKSLAVIQKEISAYQRCPPEGAEGTGRRALDGGVFPPSSADPGFAIRRFQRLARMPFWLTQLVHRRLTRDPEFFGRTVGTCGLTLLEGDWGEHLFPVAPSSVVFGLGAARREPVVRGGREAGPPARLGAVATATGRPPRDLTGEGFTPSAWGPGEIVIRRMLKCCLMIDNYVVPGLTGARLAREFQELLESGSVVTRELSPEARQGGEEP
jgi:pyruvate/2-oxoglutarate dehydrogenase complex dihydrolipoamide acyltransferase (E2) component